jgi:cytochrome P450
MGIGTGITLAELDADPYPVLARLRASEPAAWVPALDAWLVTGYDLAVSVLRDATTFTVDDPRFSTARVVGPSMLSLDGARHARHRGSFSQPFRADAVHARLAGFIQRETDRLVRAIEPRGEAELRRAVAGPLAAAVMAQALGLPGTDPVTILTWYDEIVAATATQAGDASARASAGYDGQTQPAFAELAEELRRGIAGSAVLSGAVRAGLTDTETVSNAAVLMFGGIETTEGMITNVLLHLLANPDQLALVQDDPGLLPAAVEESLRLEPAAAVVDRYATADTTIGKTHISAGDQVTVSITGANRDPAVFPDPDRYRVHRRVAGRHLAFAHGPHFCLGAPLARLETRIATETMLARLPRLRLAEPGRPPVPRGVVFRKPSALRVCWDLAG